MQSDKTRGAAAEAAFLELTGVSLVEFWQLLHATPGSTPPKVNTETTIPNKEAHTYSDNVMNNSNTALNQTFVGPTGLQAKSTWMGHLTLACHALKHKLTGIWESVKSAIGINRNDHVLEIATADGTHAHQYPVTTAGSYTTTPENRGAIVENATALLTSILPQGIAAQHVDNASHMATVSDFRGLSLGGDVATSSTSFAQQTPQTATHAAASVTAAMADDNVFASRPASSNLFAQQAADDDGWVDVATDLQHSDSVCIVDFRLLLATNLPKGEGKLFDQHARIMTEASRGLYTAGGQTVSYCPILGNSAPNMPHTYTPAGHNNSIDTVLAHIETQFNTLLEAEQTALKPLLIQLKTLAMDPATYDRPGPFIKMFTLLRIVAAKFPKNIVLMMGCKSAKDRTQSAICASDQILQLYHAKGNLDFLDTNGQLINSKLTDADRQFLQVQCTNIVGMNWLSQMGTGCPNNCQLPMLKHLVDNVPAVAIRQSTAELRKVAG